MGEKGRKALFSLDELFKDCLFLEDVSYDDSNKIKQDNLPCYSLTFNEIIDC